jgi:tetratricopeptide (TPR) repeat protein
VVTRAKWIGLPDDYEAHYYLGVTLEKKGDVPGAFNEYAKVLQLKPDNPEVAVKFGEAGLAVKNIDGSIAACRRAIQFKPDLPEAHHCLGQALFAKGDVEAAIAEYRTALQLNPKYAEAHNDLGSILYNNQKDIDGSVAEFREAIRLNPGFAMAHHNLGFALERKHDRKNALEEFRIAYVLEPGNASYRKDYETLLRKSKQ